MSQVYVKHSHKFSTRMSTILEKKHSTDSIKLSTQEIEDLKSKLILLTIFRTTKI